MDRVSALVRSRIMSRIRSKDTAPEMALRKALHARGLRYRIHLPLRGKQLKPDVTFTKARLCVFVDGCFWHRCPACFRAPSSNKAYWGPKLRRNVQRDRRDERYLRRSGWRVVRLWEHAVRGDLDASVAQVVSALKRKK